MTVTTITYGRLINTGNYENFKMEMIATVTPEEDPLVASAALSELLHAAIRAEMERRGDAQHWQWPDLFPPKEA